MKNSRGHKNDKLTLREYIESILDERYRLQDQRFVALERNVEKEDDRFRHLLEGFPQHYATKAEIDQVRSVAEDVKAHLVGRETFEDLKSKVDSNSGFRSSMIMTAGIIMTIVVVLLGVLISQIPTHDQISAQIKSEAPWVSDKPAVESDLKSQHDEIQRLEAQIAALQAKVTYLCRAARPRC